VLEAFAERLQAVEDQLRKHVPTGTSSEAFFSSLGDDGMAWDKICRFGGRIFAMLEAAGASDREAHPDFSSAAIAEITRYDAASPQVYPHESDIKQLKAALDVIWPELDQVNRIELPRRVFMIGTLAERSQTNGGLFDADVVSVFNFLKGVAVSMTAQARIGQTDIALQHVAHISQLCYSLVPTRLLEALMLTRIRGEIASLLLGMAEARVLPIDKLIAIRDSLAALPLTLEFISVGETLNGLSHLGASGSSASFLREWVSGPWVKQGPQFLEEALGIFEMFSRGLDRSTPVGKLCSPLPFQVSMTDALAACKEVPLLTNLIASSTQEFAVLASIGAHEVKAKQSSDGVSSGGLPVETIESRYAEEQIRWGFEVNWSAFTTERPLAPNLWVLGTYGLAGSVGGGGGKTRGGFRDGQLYVDPSDYTYQLRSADTGTPLFSILDESSPRGVTAYIPFEVISNVVGPRQSEIEWRRLGSSEWNTYLGPEAKTGLPSERERIVVSFPCDVSTEYLLALTVLYERK